MRARTGSADRRSQVVSRGPGVAFHVYCDECRDSTDDAQGYVISCERAATPDDWAAWVEQVGPKTWMRKRDVLAMLRFWYRGHGLEPPPLP